MYNVLLTQRVLKDLDALEKQVRIRIIKNLKEYASKPIRDIRKLESPKIEHIDLELVNIGYI